MGETIYRVLPKDDQWTLEHDGQSIAYKTRTAAFEAAINAAQHALRSADEVKIYVAPAPGQNASWPSPSHQ
jgi:anti-sigma regulatory factor (Ser/Thr protein kinase)